MSTTATPSSPFRAAPATRQRALRLETLEELATEADRIAAADAEGRLRCGGTWSAAQVFGHLATWMRYSYDGFPFAAPLWLRLAAPLIRRRFVAKTFPRGIRLPIAKEQMGADADRSTAD